MNKKETTSKNILFELCQSMNDTFSDIVIGMRFKLLTSITKEEDLNCLLEVFEHQKKSKITEENLFFILSNSHLLKDLFYDGEKINKEKLKLLDPPYDMLLNESYIFAKYCLEIKLDKDIPDESFSEISKVLGYSNDEVVHTLEEYVTKKDVPIEDVANASKLFFALYLIYNKLFISIEDLSILITTAFMIYENSIPENAKSDADAYLIAISNRRPESLNNIYYYLNTFHNINYKGLKLFKCTDLWSSKIFELENKTEVLTEMINSEYYYLLFKSPNIALKFYLHEKETGKKPYFHELEKISKEGFREFEQIM